MYNITNITTQTNLLEMVLALNGESELMFFSIIYVAIGLIIMMGIYFSTQDYNSALAFGGWMSFILGAGFFFLGLVPILSPMPFLFMALIGTALEIMGK